MVPLIYTRATNTGREGGLHLRGFLALVTQKGGGELLIYRGNRGKRR